MGQLLVHPRKARVFGVVTHLRKEVTWPYKFQYDGLTVTGHPKELGHFQSAYSLFLDERYCHIELFLKMTNSLLLSLREREVKTF